MSRYDNYTESFDLYGRYDIARSSKVKRHKVKRNPADLCLKDMRS